MVSAFDLLKPNFRMPYFVFSVSVKNKKSNLETRISTFSVTIKRKVKYRNKDTIFFTVFLNFLTF